MNSELEVEKNLIEQDKLASRGKRWANVAIDTIFFFPAIFVLYAPFHFIASDEQISKFWAIYTATENVAMSGYASLFLYFVICELTIGKMPGKLFTKTIVVSKKTGKEAGVLQRVFRSIIKTFYPEAISMLFGKNSQYALHDILSATRVVKNSEI